MTEINIKVIRSDEFQKYLTDLADVLHQTVIDGASIGFILPFSVDDSHAFWRDRVLPSLLGGGCILWGAWFGERVIGTVQLDLEVFPNQHHRGEVAKLLVHPDFRGRGIAKALMAELEQRARDLGKSLLTLDTKTGDTAEPLYLGLGYQTAGVIPGYCRAPEEDRYDSTTYMYKSLSGTE